MWASVLGRAHLRGGRTRPRLPPRPSACSPPAAGDGSGGSPAAGAGTQPHTAYIGAGAAPAPAPPPSPPATSPAPAASQSPRRASTNKGPALSPDAPPFYPGGTPGRSKSMRWTELSDCSDSDCESISSLVPQPSTSTLSAGAPRLGGPSQIGRGPAPTLVPGSSNCSRWRRSRSRLSLGHWARSAAGGGGTALSAAAVGQTPHRVPTRSASLCT